MNWHQLLTQEGKKRREAALDDNDKQKSKDDLQPETRMNGEKGRLEEEEQRRFFFLCSCPYVFGTKFAPKSERNGKLFFCHFSLHVTFSSSLSFLLKRTLADALWKTTVEFRIVFYF